MVPPAAVERGRVWIRTSFGDDLSEYREKGIEYVRVAGAWVCVGISDSTCDGAVSEGKSTVIHSGSFSSGPQGSIRSSMRLGPFECDSCGICRSADLLEMVMNTFCQHAVFGCTQKANEDLHSAPPIVEIPTVLFDLHYRHSLFNRSVIQQSCKTHKLCYHS